MAHKLVSVRVRMPDGQEFEVADTKTADERYPDGKVTMLFSHDDNGNVVSETPADRAAAERRAAKAKSAPAKPKPPVIRKVTSRPTPASVPATRTETDPDAPETPVVAVGPPVGPSTP